MMDWRALLSADRLGDPKPRTPDPARSPFQIDCDRIIFSSAFRRLQDKTQVHPLAENDYVRTRLTHSLEVASVGRSLGARVGAELVRRHGLEALQLHASDFGAVIQAAALAHDLGNPPFGHSGEDTIRDWFRNSATAGPMRLDMTAEQAADFERFEGNAQGFRIVARLQMPDNPGLRLTFATLGAFTKYPRAAICDPGGHVGASVKKFGFFQAEREDFAAMAGRCGLAARGRDCWARHPLAFLVEAADDICYRLVDFEDGFRLGHLSYAQVVESFLRVTGDPKDRVRAERMDDRKNQIAFLRAQAIGAAVGQTAQAFLDREEALLRGEFDAPLLDHIPAAEELNAIKRASVETIYNTQRGVAIEVRGHGVLTRLLDCFAGAVDETARLGKAASPHRRKLLQLVPEQFIGPQRVPAPDAYTRLLRITDFVSGMTDSYALKLAETVGE
jgi:dGTPase